MMQRMTSSPALIGDVAVRDAAADLRLVRGDRDRLAGRVADIAAGITSDTTALYGFRLLRTVWAEDPSTATPVGAVPFMPILIGVARHDPAMCGAEVIRQTRGWHETDAQGMDPAAHRAWFDLSDQVASGCGTVARADRHELIAWHAAMRHPVIWQEERPAAAAHLHRAIVATLQDGFDDHPDELQQATAAILWHQRKGGFDLREVRRGIEGWCDEVEARRGTIDVADWHPAPLPETWWCRIESMAYVGCRHPQIDAVIARRWNEAPLHTPDRCFAVGTVLAADLDPTTRQRLVDRSVASIGAGGAEVLSRLA